MMGLRSHHSCWPFCLSSVLLSISSLFFLVAPHQSIAYLCSQQRLRIGFYWLTAHWVDKRLFGSVTIVTCYTLNMCHHLLGVFHKLSIFYMNPLLTVTSLSSFFIVSSRSPTEHLKNEEKLCFFHQKSRQ